MIREDIKVRRSKRAKQAAQTRIKRQNMKIYEAARELIAGRLKLTGSSSHCRICGKALTDEPSINREVGPECWSRVMRTVEAVKISDMGLDQEDFDMIGFYDPKTGSIEGLDVFDLVALKFGVTTKSVRETVARAYAIFMQDEKKFYYAEAWAKFCEMGKDIALDDASAERVLISMKRLFDAASLKIKSRPFDPYKLDDEKVMMERSGLSRSDYYSYIHLEPFDFDDEETALSLFFDDTQLDVESLQVIANAAHRDVPLVQMAAAHVASDDAQW